VITTAWETGGSGFGSSNIERSSGTSGLVSDILNSPHQRASPYRNRPLREYGIPRCAVDGLDDEV
jgi:hypothetical protein